MLCFSWKEAALGLGGPHAHIAALLVASSLVAPLHWACLNLSGHHLHPSFLCCQQHHKGHAVSTGWLWPAPGAHRHPHQPFPHAASHTQPEWFPHWLKQRWKMKLTHYPLICWPHLSHWIVGLWLSCYGSRQNLGKLWLQIPVPRPLCLTTFSSELHPRINQGSKQGWAPSSLSSQSNPCIFHLLISKQICGQDYHQLWSPQILAHLCCKNLLYYAKLSQAVLI